MYFTFFAVEFGFCVQQMSISFFYHYFAVKTADLF